MSIYAAEGGNKMAPRGAHLANAVVLYNSPLNQPGRRSRFRAEPEVLSCPDSTLNLGAVRRLNPLAFGNTAF